MKFKLEEANRPESKQEEDRYFLEHFRGILDEIIVILRMPGSPSYSDIPKALRKRLKQK